MQKPNKTARFTSPILRFLGLKYPPDYTELLYSIPSTLTKWRGQNMPDQTSSTPISTSKIRLVTGINPAQALGFAVSYLMTKPAFACLSFGHWSRVLVGQINRGHYLLASDGANIVGFLGWALTTREKGDMWLAGRGELAFEDSKGGEILLINAWAAESNEVTQVILERLREIGHSQEMVYFKRLYPDGRVRPGRLSVNAFVDTHIRAAQTAGQKR